MRWSTGILVFTAAGLWTWHVWEERRLAAEAAAAAEETARVPVVAASPSGLPRTGMARPGITPAADWDARARGAATRTWGRLRGAPEPPPDRLVHCALGDVGEFLRRSECERRGGFVDEPDWARLHGSDLAPSDPPSKDPP